MIRVGPAGWSYKDWEGTVYPPHGSRFDALAYLAYYFDTIEVKSEPEALLLEGKLIKQWRPKYNTDFTDDKRFLLVRLNTADELKEIYKTGSGAIRLRATWEEGPVTRGGKRSGRKLNGTSKRSIESLSRTPCTRPSATGRT